MPAEESQTLLLTHHGEGTRTNELLFVQQHYGKKAKKIICVNVEDAIKKINALAEKDELNKETIRLIFLEANLGHSGDVKTSITVADLLKLREEFPEENPIHIHFFSGGTGLVTGLDDLITAVATEKLSITSGVGIMKPSFGINRIPPELRILSSRRASTSSKGGTPLARDVSATLTARTGTPVSGDVTPSYGVGTPLSMRDTPLAGAGGSLGINNVSLAPLSALPPFHLKLPSVFKKPSEEMVDSRGPALSTPSTGEEPSLPGVPSVIDVANGGKSKEKKETVPQVPLFHKEAESAPAISSWWCCCFRKKRVLPEAGEERHAPKTNP